VADLALFDSVLTQDSAPIRATALRGMRIGVVRAFFYQGLDPEVAAITDTALRTLRSAGVELIEGDLPDLAHFVELCTLPVINHDLRPALSRYLSRSGAGITFETLLAQSSPAIRAVIEPSLTPGQPGYVSGAQYRQVVRRHLPAFRRMYHDYFRKARVAALVFPTTRLPAPKLGGEDMQVELAGARLSLYEALSRNIAPGSTAGLPGLVLPAGQTKSGLPVALEFDGPAGADRTVLALGLAVEAVLGGLPAPLDLSRVVT
jgi:mandelamide amidase